MKTVILLAILEAFALADDLPQPPLAAPTRDRSQTVAEYNRRKVGFMTLTTVTRRGEYEWTQPYQGVLGRPLTTDEFYNIVGRPDYADFWSAKHRLKTGLIYGGGAIGIVAVITGAILSVKSTGHGSCREYSPPPFADQCFVHGDNTGMKDGGIAVASIGGAIGVAMALAGFVINPLPTTVEEAYQLADGYNQRLRTQLGVEDHTQRHDSLHLTITPTASRDGAGAQLRIAF